MTLKPGEILATVTPAEVGMPIDPPQFFDVGDVLRVEIDHVRHIENRVVGETIPSISPSYFVR